MVSRPTKDYAMHSARMEESTHLKMFKYNIKMYRYLALKEVLSNGRNTNFIDIAQ